VGWGGGIGSSAATQNDYTLGLGPTRAQSARPEVLRAARFFSANALFFNLSYLDQSHYNFSVSEKRHYNSCILKFAITILCFPPKRHRIRMETT
jgi:hypothetical protein